MQKVIRVLQWQSLALGVFPVEQRAPSARETLDIPWREVAMLPACRQRRYVSQSFDCVDDRPTLLAIIILRGDHASPFLPVFRQRCGLAGKQQRMQYPPKLWSQLSRPRPSLDKRLRADGSSPVDVQQSRRKLAILPCQGVQYLCLMQYRSFRLLGQRNLDDRLTLSRRSLHQVHHRFPLATGRADINHRNWWLAHLPSQ